MYELGSLTQLLCLQMLPVGRERSVFLLSIAIRSNKLNTNPELSPFIKSACLVEATPIFKIPSVPLYRSIAYNNHRRSFFRYKSWSVITSQESIEVHAYLIDCPIIFSY